jgi:hypothetical protein
VLAPWFGPTLRESCVLRGSLEQLGGGLQSPAHISAAHAAACIAENRDVIVGLKVAKDRRGPRRRSAPLFAVPIGIPI